MGPNYPPNYNPNFSVGGKYQSVSGSGVAPYNSNHRQIHPGNLNTATAPNHLSNSLSPTKLGMLLEQHQQHYPHQPNVVHHKFKSAAQSASQRGDGEVKPWSITLRSISQGGKTRSLTRKNNMHGPGRSVNNHSKSPGKVPRIAANLRPPGPIHLPAVNQHTSQHQAMQQQMQQQNMRPSFGNRIMATHTNQNLSLNQPRLQYYDYQNGYGHGDLNGVHQQRFHDLELQQRHQYQAQQVQHKQGLHHHHLLKQNLNNNSNITLSLRQRPLSALIDEAEESAALMPSPEHLTTHPETQIISEAFMREHPGFAKDLEIK